MFVKTRKAEEDGWSIYLNVSEVHTKRLSFDKFSEYIDIKLNHIDQDVRFNVRRITSPEINRIDDHEQMQHGFIIIEFICLDNKQPMCLLTNMITYLCEDNGNTAQKLY